MRTGSVNANAYIIMQKEQPQKTLPKEDIQDVLPYEQESKDIFLLKNGQRMTLTKSLIEREEDEQVRVTYTIGLPASCTAGELIGKGGQKIKKMQDKFGGYMSIKGGDIKSEKGRRAPSTKMQTSREPIYAIVRWTGQLQSKHRVLEAALEALRECLDEAADSRITEKQYMGAGCERGTGAAATGAAATDARQGPLPGQADEDLLTTDWTVIEQAGTQTRQQQEPRNIIMASATVEVSVSEKADEMTSLEEWLSRHRLTKEMRVCIQALRQTGFRTAKDLQYIDKEYIEQSELNAYEKAKLRRLRQVYQEEQTQPEHMPAHVTAQRHGEGDREETQQEEDAAASALQQRQPAGDNAAQEGEPATEGAVAFQPEDLRTQHTAAPTPNMTVSITMPAGDIIQITVQASCQVGQIKAGLAVRVDTTLAVVTSQIKKLHVPSPCTLSGAVPARGPSEIRVLPWGGVA